MNGKYLPIIIFIALSSILAIGLKWNNRALPSPLIGKNIPQMHAASSFDENQFFNPQLVNNKVWLLNVFASWCSGCYEEHEVLTRLINKNNLLAIGLNYKDDTNNAKKWLNTLGNPYSFIINDHTGSIGIDWGVYGVPETFIIDKNGVIRHKVTGPLNERTIEKTIEPLLAKLYEE